MRQTACLGVLLIGVFSAACAGRTSMDASRRNTPGTASSASVVTAAELSKYANSTLLDALSAVRPWLLNGRGTPPSVSIDGAAATDISALRWISVATVAEVRLLRGSGSADARTRLLANGDAISGDVLLVKTRITK